jgi:hypothetical protein
MKGFRVANVWCKNEDMENPDALRSKTLPDNLRVPFDDLCQGEKLLSAWGFRHRSRGMV